jgi:hypothetical protein
MIYTHVMNKGGRGMKSPLDRNGQGRGFRIRDWGPRNGGPGLETIASRAIRLIGVPRRPSAFIGGLISALRAARAVQSSSRDTLPDAGTCPPFRNRS